MGHHWGDKRPIRDFYPDPPSIRPGFFSELGQGALLLLSLLGILALMVLLKGFGGGL